MSNDTPDSEIPIEDREQKIEFSDEYPTIQGERVTCDFCKKEYAKMPDSYHKMLKKDHVWMCGDEQCWKDNHALCIMLLDKSNVASSYTRGKYKITKEVNPVTGKCVSTFLFNHDTLLKVFSDEMAKQISTSSDGEVFLPQFDSEEEVDNYIDGVNLLQ